MTNTSRVRNIAAAAGLVLLGACGGGGGGDSSSGSTTGGGGSGATGGSGSTGAINSTGSTNTSTTYGASLKALAEANHGISLLLELGDLTNVIGSDTNTFPGDCQSLNGNPNGTATPIGQFPVLGSGAFSAGEQFNACGVVNVSTHLFTGAISISGTTNTATTVDLTASWTSPITSRNPFASSNSIVSLAPGSLSMSGAGVGDNSGSRNSTWTFASSSSNPSITLQAGTSSSYTFTSLNGSVIVGPSSLNGSVTHPATVSGNGTGGFVGNIAKGGVTYAVSVTKPIVFGSVTPSTLNGGNANASSGTAVIDYGNTACGALSVTFASDGSGFTMSCATAPSTTQTVLWSSADWQTAQSASNQ